MIKPKSSKPTVLIKYGMVKKGNITFNPCNVNKEIKFINKVFELFPSKMVEILYLISVRFKIDLLLIILIFILLDLFLKR